jgi:hypothetical protein
MSPDLIAYWQRQLRLQGWDIEVTEVPAYLIDKLGQCMTVENTRRARIQIAVDEDGKPCDDAEMTLVHELLHVSFPGVDDGRSSTRQEQAIEATAQALVRLNRGERR